MTTKEDLEKILSNKTKQKEELTLLKARIEKGESLGDSIKDFIFMYYGKTDLPEFKEKIEDLQEKIASHQGKQIMVLRTREVDVMRGGPDSEPWYQTKVCGLQLGILKGELGFNLGAGEIILPVERYVQKGSSPYFSFECKEKDWKLQEEGITIAGYQFHVTLSGLDSHFNIDSENLDLNILFGDEVELYFTTIGHEFEVYQQSKLTAENPEEFLQMYFKNHVDEFGNRYSDYIPALNLLNENVPKRFQEKFDQQLKQKKEDILKHIYGPDHRNRDKYFQHAVELGMHNEERTFELEPGITMNISKYIRANCELYNIDIP